MSIFCVCVCEKKKLTKTFALIGRSIHKHFGGDDIAKR